MELGTLLEQFINEELIDVVISNPKNKEIKASKIKIRPVLMKNQLQFQATSQVEKQVFHENYDEDSLKMAMTRWIVEEYKQAQFTAKGQSATVLSGKKGNLTIKVLRKQAARVQAPLSHNREKRYILEEGTPVPFLVDLGVMTSEGKIVNARYDKFKQINRFLEFIEDILPNLDQSKTQTIIDFGCGKSYLTFAMYYYLKVLKGYQVNIIGLDLKKDVMERCQKLAERYGYSELRFLTGDIADYNDVDQVDMVVTLHACDTATDYALYKAVKWGAKVILSVPCCQHEANNQIQNEPLQNILKYGILKEKMSALLTDGIRANLLEEQGYKTQILEFIDMEHTPKNLLIRAVKADSDTVNSDKSSNNKDNAVKADNKKAVASAAKELEQFLSLDLTLGRLFRGEQE